VKWRKKPIEVEATQWFKTGDHPAVIRAWTTPRGDTTNELLGEAYDFLAEEFAAIQTLEGLMRVRPGDWVVTGVQGEHYAVEPDIFEASYERADDETYALRYNSRVG